MVDIVACSAKPLLWWVGGRMDGRVPRWAATDHLRGDQEAFKFKTNHRFLLYANQLLGTEGWLKRRLGAAYF
jgi:hypothetical protein